ncbi:small integral membrane protein 33 [Sarcophilus harrisii]|uniref:small integral membrane protein 33 n=1 Tax=Sarcophilus harrisii TaxID=9305 RepID=UPI000226FED6|nr:small integral membrane protein 33 [Sarcophilus harrisii]
MNSSVEQYSPNCFGTLGGHQNGPKGDGLPLLAVIVALFVLLAICIIMVVHFGPELRKVQFTLPREPPTPKQEGGIHLIHWKALGSQLANGPQENYMEAQPWPAATSLCTHSSIMELTYL